MSDQHLMVFFLQNYQCRIGPQLHARCLSNKSELDGIFSACDLPKGTVI